jgi:hypothetical protein
MQFAPPSPGGPVSAFKPKSPLQLAALDASLSIFLELDFCGIEYA